MEEYIGVIRGFAGVFVPQYWMMCDGRLLAVSQYSGLFHVIGNKFGGDGVTSFALPDLRSRIPVGVADGTEPGGAVIALGQQGGEESHVLAYTEMPTHNHIIQVSGVNASSPTPVGSSSALAGVGSVPGATFIAANGYNNAGPDTVINGGTIANTGASDGHENRQPYLAMNYIICVEGLYPPRN